MARRIRVKINSAGAAALLKSGEVAADLERRAQSIQAGAGVGYTADVRQGRTRQRAMVRTDSFDAARDNAKNNTLLKNLGRGA